MADQLASLDIFGMLWMTLLSAICVIAVAFISCVLLGSLWVFWMWFYADLPEVELPGGIDEFRARERDHWALEAKQVGARDPSPPLRRYLDQRCDDEHTRQCGGEA